MYPKRFWPKLSFIKSVPGQPVGLLLLLLGLQLQPLLFGLGGRAKVSFLSLFPGTDVMIFKIFSPKIFAKKLAF
jgi:hypothetical protein